MVLMLTLLLALLPGAVSALESEPAPELKITASPAALSWDGISTRSYHSTVSLAAGSSVTLTPTDPGQKISALYLVWSKVPGSWTLGYNGKSETFGQNGYLHEFVALEDGAEEGIDLLFGVFGEFLDFFRGGKVKDRPPGVGHSHGKIGVDAPAADGPVGQRADGPRRGPIGGDKIKVF